MNRYIISTTVVVWWIAVGIAGILINTPGYIECYSGFKNLQMLARIQGKISDAEIKGPMRTVGLDPDSKIRVKKYPWE